MTVSIDSDGFYFGGLTDEIVADCSHQGACDDDVEYWRKRLNLSETLGPMRDLVVDYLREFGAWEDLDTADMDTLADRVLWIACGEISEQGEWIGLCH